MYKYDGSMQQSAFNHTPLINPSSRRPHSMSIKLWLIFFLLTGCANYSAKYATIGAYDISGKVIDTSTSDPVASALVIMTIPEGDSWHLPSSFLIGYAYSRPDGSFVIPARPREVKNIRRASALITIDTFHPAYTQSVAFITRSEKPETVTVKMKKADDSRPSLYNCTYNNPEICKIVSRYLGY